MKGVIWGTGIAITSVVSVISGGAWLLQPIETPLWAILLLTFLPMESMNRALQKRLGTHPKTDT